MTLNPLAALTDRIADNVVAQGFALGVRAVEALESMAASARELALTAKAQRQILDGTGHFHPTPQDEIGAMREARAFEGRSR